MATSLGTDGDILQHIRAHMPLSNAIHGEEAMEGNGGSSGNTTRHLFFWHHQDDHQWSRDARGGHSSKHQQQLTTRASLTQEGPTTTWPWHIPPQWHTQEGYDIDDVAPPAPENQS